MEDLIHLLYIRLDSGVRDEKGKTAFLIVLHQDRANLSRKDARSPQALLDRISAKQIKRFMVWVRIQAIYEFKLNFRGSETR